MSSESGLRSRSESGLNLNVHFHRLFIDGTYELGDQGEPIDLCASDPPTLKELDQVLALLAPDMTWTNLGPRHALAVQLKIVAVVQLEISGLHVYKLKSP